jgi:GcrA cell cycle regulator
MSWTDDRVEVLKKLWGEGRTAAEIAKELGGVTRNAVIGKAHRLKLSGRVSPLQQVVKKPANNPGLKPVIADKKVIKKMPAMVPMDLKADQDRVRIPLIELQSGQCRWPIGDPRDANFGFCGDHSEDGSPYCAAHSQVAYQVSSRNRQLKVEDLEKEEAARAEKMALNS